MAGYGMFHYAAARFPRNVRNVNDWLLIPRLQPAPPGPLAEPVLQRLLSAAETLLAVPVKTNHYEDFFRWHAETLPGYKALYEQFVSTLDQAARPLAECDFSECEAPIRTRILAKAFQVRDTDSSFQRLRTAMFDRDWLLYDQYIVREVFLLFANTDALLLLGYEAWPGTPRGLDNYTQPPTQLISEVLR